MGRNMRATALITALGVCASLAAPASALAHGFQVAYASDNGGGPSGPNEIDVGVLVTAEIPSSCGTTTLPNATVNVGELNAVIANTQVALTINCSAAFRMGLVSSNGGLRSGVAAPAGYTNLRDYNVSLHIVDNTLAGNDSSTCHASQLTTGSSACLNLIGPATSSAPGFRVANASNNQSGSYLLISNTALTGSNILVSDNGYTDTLTITLTAAP
jgi:hypothetical protein